MTNKKLKILKLVTWIIIFQLIGYMMGNITKSNLIWYHNLYKSAITPPDSFFPIIWSLLYLIISITFCFLSGNRIKLTSKFTLPSYTLHVLLNWSWTPLFFVLHYTGLSFIVILLMVMTTIIVIITVKSDFLYITLALVPYLGWQLFAAYLNLYILIYN
jgi:translocator protein